MLDITFHGFGYNSWDFGPAGRDCISNFESGSGIFYTSIELVMPKVDVYVSFDIGVFAYLDVGCWMFDVRRSSFFTTGFGGILFLLQALLRGRVVESVALKKRSISDKS